MHHKQDSVTDLGTIRIHNNVISSIASIAALEIQGVKRLGQDLRCGILELIGQKNLTAIKVETDKNEEVKVNIPLVVKYGFNIPEIANKVQENVRSHLEKMTNLSIKDINIIVQGVEKE